MQIQATFLEGHTAYLRESEQDVGRGQEKTGKRETEFLYIPLLSYKKKHVFFLFNFVIKAQERKKRERENVE